MIRSFLQHEHLLKDINKTFLVLIPKGQWRVSLTIDQLVCVMPHIKLNPNFWPIAKFNSPKIVFLLQNSFVSNQIFMIKF